MTEDFTASGDLKWPPVDLARVRRRREAEKQGNDSWTVRDALLDMVDDIDQGRIKPNKVVIVARTDEGETSFDEHWTLAGLKFSEAVSVLEYRKHRILMEMAGD